MQAKVSKKSVRDLTKMQRLPTSLKLFLPGACLLEILKANSLDKKFRLWHSTYWVVARSTNPKHMSITWRPVNA